MILLVAIAAVVIYLLGMGTAVVLFNQQVARATMENQRLTERQGGLFDALALIDAWRAVATDPDVCQRLDEIRAKIGSALVVHDKGAIP